MLPPLQAVLVRFLLNGGNLNISTDQMMSKGSQCHSPERLLELHARDHEEDRHRANGPGSLLAGVDGLFSVYCDLCSRHWLCILQKTQDASCYFLYCISL